MSHPDIAQIYMEYRDRVMGYIYARLRSRADAEDLCQDVFEKVHLKLDSFDPEKASISTWIYSITRNSVIDFYRRNHPHEEINENIAMDDSIDDDMLNEETLEELAEALEKLPEQLREITVLRYYDGMPLTEIAKKMRLSYGAIKLRHAKALELIRKSMP